MGGKLLGGRIGFREGNLTLDADIVLLMFVLMILDDIHTTSKEPDARQICAGHDPRVFDVDEASNLQQLVVKQAHALDVNDEYLVRVYAYGNLRRVLEINGAHGGRGLELRVIDDLDEGRAVSEGEDVGRQREAGEEGEDEFQGWGWVEIRR